MVERIVVIFLLILARARIGQLGLGLPGSTAAHGSLRMWCMFC